MCDEAFYVKGEHALISMWCEQEYEKKYGSLEKYNGTRKKCQKENEKRPESHLVKKKLSVNQQSKVLVYSTHM